MGDVAGVCGLNGGAVRRGMRLGPDAIWSMVLHGGAQHLSLYHSDVAKWCILCRQPWLAKSSTRTWLWSVCGACGVDCGLQQLWRTAVAGLQRLALSRTRGVHQQVSLWCSACHMRVMCIDASAYNRQNSISTSACAVALRRARFCVCFIAISGAFQALLPGVGSHCPD